MKKMMKSLIAAIGVALMMTGSAFAAEELPTKGYEITIYNADGTEGMTVNGEKSVSPFCLKTAIEDARVFVNNASLFGITTPAIYVVEMYENSTENASFEIGSDVTINGNGYKIVCAEGVTVKNNGTLNDATIEAPAVAVAKIGGAEYTNFADALAAAKAMMGDVTVEIYEKVTLNQALAGNYSSISFVGTDADAEIYLDVQGYTTATGKTVNFTDLKLSKSEGGYLTNAGFMNTAFGIYDIAAVNYTNCTFLNGAYASSGKNTFTGCTFYRSHDRYGLWAYGAQNIVVDRCTFADIRGIKMYDEGKAGITSITVKNTSFAAVTDKPAIVLTYGNSVTLENNTYGAKGTFELDLDGKPNGVTVSSDVPPTCINDNGACGVLVDGKIYTTVAQAAEVATATSTVTLLHNSAETVQFQIGVTLNKNGFEAAGITVAQPVAKIGDTPYSTLQAAVAAAQAGDTVVVIGATAGEAVVVDKDLTITGEVTLTDVSINGTAGKLTVSNLTFVGNSWINAGGCDELVVENVTANVAPSNRSYTNSRNAFIGLGKNEGKQLKLAVTGCNIVVPSGTNAVLGWAAVTEVAISGNTFGSEASYQNSGDIVKFMAIADGAVINIINNTSYSNYNGFVFAQNTTRDNSYAVYVSGNTFYGGADHIWIEITGGDTVHAKVEATSDNTVNGNKFTATDIKYHYGVIKNWDGYAGVDVTKDSEGKLTGGSFLLAPSANMLADGFESKKNADGTYGVAANPAYGKVAKIGDNYYATLSAAFAAVTDDAQTVTILKDVTENLTGAYLRGNITTENDAKVTITLTNSDWVYCPYTFVIGKDVTLKTPALFYYAGGAIIKGTVITDAYYQRYAGTKLYIEGTMTVNSGTFILRYTDGDANAGIYVNGGTLNASVIYFYQGMISATNGGKINVGTYWQTNETDGQGSANLVLDNSTLTVSVYDHSAKATGNSTVTLKNGSTMNCQNGGFTYGETALVTVDSTSSIIGKGGEVVKIPVAKIGGNGYTSLEDAFAAAKEGETIVMLADATPALTSQRAITKAAIVDLGGKMLTLTEDDLYFGTTTFKNGTIVVDPSVKPSTAVFWMFANQTLTFDNVKLVATGVTGTYLIGLDGNNADLNVLNGSEILVENTTALDLDIICVNASTGNDIVINNSKVKVTNLDGRVFFRGNYTISGNSDIDLSGITKAGFRIEAGQTLTIADTATVDIVGEPRDGGIHLTDVTATYTKAESATVNATVNRPAIAQIGDAKYASLAEAAAAAKADDEIVLLADVAEDVTVPAGVIFNGNGKQVGVITAAGTITFKGVIKATNFGTQYTNTTINIGEGACLEITGTGRLVIGHGCTFNITGTIADAKTADKATLTPSLIMPGASFTGAGVTFNVKNAYIFAPSSYCSSSKSASGKFDFNIENSIIETAGKLAFEAQSTAATVNFELKNSVLNTGSHLVFGVAAGEVVIDNSNVNVGKSNQIENRSTMTVKNGSVVNGAVATSSNAINPGTIIVENATYAVTGQFSGSTVGTGTLIIKKGANVSVGSIVDKANIQIDATGMCAGDEINLTANLSKFAGTVEVINNDKLDASIVDGKIVLALKPVAQIGETKYTTLEDAFKAATSGCTIEILSDVVVDYNWDARYKGSKFTVPVTIDGKGKKIKFNASVNDNNYHAAFRFEADAIVKNLIIDMSETTDNRFRAISSKGNLSVVGCKFIGKDPALNCRAIIFGEGAGDNVGNLAISIVDSEFINWKRGVTDNENAKDVKSVTITGNTFKNANVAVSAAESVTFSNNTMDNGIVDIRSYSAENNLSVIAQDNTLTESDKNYIYAKTINAQAGFTAERVPTTVSTYEQLIAALAEDNAYVVLANDITATATQESGYGKAGIVVEAGDVLDGNGKTLTINGANATWDCVIAMKGGEVKNLTIAGAMRGVFMPGANGDVVIDNCKFQNVIYTFNSDAGNKNYTVTIKNTELNGWTSFSDAHKAVIFDTCTFAKGNGYAYCRPYQATTFNNCSFSGDFEIDCSQANDNKLAFNDCTYNGQAITSQNAFGLFGDGSNVLVNGAPADYTRVAQVGTQIFADLQEAIKAAAPDGTVTLLKDVVVDEWKMIAQNLTVSDNSLITLNINGMTINGNGNTLTVNSISSPEREKPLFYDAENLTVSNLTITVNAKTPYDGGIGLKSGTIDNVTFNGGRYAVLPGTGDVTVKGCTFNDVTGYAVYFEGDRDNLVITGNTFNCADGAYVVTLRGAATFTDNTVNTGKVNLANSAKGEVSGNNFGTERFKVYNGATAQITNNTINNLVFSDTNVPQNSKFTDNTLSAEALAALNAMNFVAQVGTTYYTSIAAAIAAAKDGETVKVFAGTYAVPAMKAGITIEGAVNADGTPAVLFEGTLSGTLEDLTMKNIHIRGGHAQRWAYAKGDLTFENVTFEATSVYALHFDGIAAGTNLEYKNCTIIGWAAMGGSPASCVFEDCTIKDNGRYGLIRTYFDTEIKNCTFDVANANTTDAYEDGIHAVEGAEITVTGCTNVNGDMKDLVNVHAKSVVTLDGVAIKNVAKIGSTYYTTLAEALAAAQNDAVVELLWAEGNAPIAMNGSVFGKSVTITGSATVDWSKGFLFVGRGGEGNGTVIFDNANLESASDNASYGIHVSGREKNTNNKYDGTVVINDSTIELDYLIDKGAMTMTNSTLTVKNGFAVGGRPASETESGVDATATFDLTNGSKLIVNNHNGMGLGYEAIGVMTIDSTSTFECTQSFLVTDKGVLKSAGNVFGDILKSANAQIELTGGIYTDEEVPGWCAEPYAALPNLNNQYVVGVKPTATVNSFGATTVPAGNYGVWNGSSYTGTSKVDMPLSFVMQFLADQNEEDMATSPYADWYGDFVITFTGIENGSFTADGCYLAGHYGEFGWVKVPVDGMTIENDARYPVMLGVGMGQKYDYICSGVQDFKCAMFLTPEIIAANPNLKVKLELAVVDNSKGSDLAASALENNDKVFSVAEYEYGAEAFAPALPTATVTSIDAPEGTPLTFALNFKADDVTDEQLDYYGDWYADFVLTITGLPEEGVTFNTDGTADGYLAGQYDAWSENWVSVPFEDVTLRNGESIKIMEYAATLLGQSGLKLTYNDVYSFVKNFDCGVYFTPEFLAANPDMKVSLSLRMYKTGDATDEGIAIGEMEEFSAPTVVAKIGSTPYATLEAAIATAGADDTVTILKNVGTDAAIRVAKKVTIDLNGKTIAATENDKVGDGVFCVVAGGDLTINDSVGTGVINGVGDNDYNIAIWANGGKVTINGGNYTNVGATDKTDPNAHFDLIYAKNGGEVIINGGTFECETPAFTLNSHDTYKGVITVNGGTFVGFDPRNNAAETAGTTFMAAGKYTFAEGGNYIVVTPEDYILNGAASDSATVGDVDSLLAGAVTVTKDGEKYVATATYTFKVTVVDTVNPEKSSYELTGGKLRPGKTVAVKYIDLATGAESWVKPESDTVTFKLVIK